MTRPIAACLCTLVVSLAQADVPPAAPANCDPDTGVCVVQPPRDIASGGKHLWADSRLFTDAPPLEVQKWLTDKPEMKGKFVVIEFWRTWCGACKRMTPLMNTLHKKYGKELVVIGITGEAEETIKAYAGPKKEYFLALDLPLPVQEGDQPQEAEAAQAEAEPVTGLPDQADRQVAARPGQGRYEAQFGVWGWPHVIILEPQYRTIIWEGFPGLKGFELTEAKIEKILAIGRTAKQEEAAAKKTRP
jgi:thiol-disulfide isomerase/thioredoxin